MFHSFLLVRRSLWAPASFNLANKDTVIQEALNVTLMIEPCRKGVALRTGCMCVRVRACVCVCVHVQEDDNMKE